MIALEKPLGQMQMEMTDYTGDWKQTQILEEASKKLERMAELQLRRYIRLNLKSRKNPPSLEAFLASISKSLARMERKGICRLQKMGDNRIYIFKGQTLRPVARSRLEKSVMLYLKSRKDSPSLETFIAYANEALPKMEEKKTCYLEKMPDGKMYLFKRIFCRESDEAWRKCPKLRCVVVFPCWQECPYVKHDVDLEFDRETLEERYLECSEEVIQEGLFDRKDT